MEVQSNEKAALLKLLKSKSRTKTELLKVSSARRRARQAALDALLAEGKVVRIDRKYFANITAAHEAALQQVYSLLFDQLAPGQRDQIDALLVVSAASEMAACTEID